jgi:long-chain fatty acid transport protein
MVNVKRKRRWPAAAIRRVPGSVNSNVFICLGVSACLARDRNPHDITAEKVGLDYKLSSKLMLRAGHNHSGLPFDASQTFFNLLAPAVVQQHFSAGATWGLPNGKEINIAYQHAFAETVNGANSIPASFGGGEANLRMHQNSVGVGFWWGR